MNKALIYSFFILSFTCVNATVYKCTDENGTIHYQSQACEDQVKEEIMNVKEEAEISINTSSNIKPTLNTKPLPFTDKHLSKREQRKMQAASKKAQCAPYLKNYARMKKQVKQKCVKDRDVYCDLPGDQIEERNYKREIEFTRVNNASNSGNRRMRQSAFRRSSRLMTVKKPPLLVAKQKLKELNCL